MASMTQVAQRAGVSIATVSRMVNRTGPVKPRTAARIRNSMQELGFSPRQNARRGAGASAGTAFRTRNVMLLSPTETEPSAMYRMPAFPAFLAGMHAALEAMGLNLILAHAPEGAPPPRALAEGRVDGIVLAGRGASRRLAPELLRALAPYPVVATLRGGMDSDAFDHVSYDNGAVGPLAADHLARRGCRRLAVACASGDHPAYMRRVEGFRQACAARGLPLEMLLSDDGVAESARRAGARKAAARIASMDPAERPDGVFCVSDDLMMSMHQELVEAGVRPEQDITLVGCNNAPAFMDLLRPRPATIDIMLAEVGRRAVEHLAWRLANPARPAVDILVRPVLAHAGTAAPASPGSRAGDRAQEVGDR